MTVELRYGMGHTIRFELPGETLLADGSRTPGTPLDDPAATVANAVIHPLNFPPLSAATVPGDRVVIALDRGVPRAAEIVAGIVHALCESGTPRDSITLVRAVADDHPPVVGGPDPPLRTVIHDPTDKSQLSYLAASRDGNPIYFNRTIFDADVVVPVGCLRLSNSLGYAGIHSGLFPTFSDEETMRRFRAPHSSLTESERQRRCEETNEAAWLLGVQFTVQVVPGPGESVLDILAGDSQVVMQQGMQRITAAWRLRVPRRAGLVVAAIEGGPEQQTWENFARALYAASQVVRDDGAIVLCTELNCQPGPALSRLASGRQEEVVRKEIQRERTDDAVSASLVADVLQRARVYLLSELEGDTVEGLGIGYVSREKEVQHLSRQHESCILLANAQHAVPTADDNY